MNYFESSLQRMFSLRPIFWMIMIGLVFSYGTPALAAATSSPTPEGLLPHFESLITLAIILLAFMIAWLLNHRSPNARFMGTLLAALSCLAIVVWFVFALQTGVFENPKPYQAPMDAAKPTLLWAQASIALLVGLWLLLVAFGQRKNSESLELPSANEADKFGRVSRILHWSTAILFIFMIPTGIFASMIPEDAWYRTEYNVVHKTIGFTILMLLIARLLWNRKSQRPALNASLKPIERKMAHGAHVALYGLMFALPVTGYIMTSLHGYPSFFFIFELKPFLAESKAYIVWGLFHKYIFQYLVYVILGGHILGALKHHYVDKHKNAIKRMVG